MSQSYDNHLSSRKKSMKIRLFNVKKNLLDIKLNFKKNTEKKLCLKAKYINR